MIIVIYLASASRAAALPTGNGDSAKSTIRVQIIAIALISV
jgi:hypothetical protein